MKSYNAIIPAVLVAVLATMAGCSSLGPQPPESTQPKAAKTSYDVDMSKPEGPVFQMFNAANERNEELFKASFAPDADEALRSQEFFRKFRKKLLVNKVSPIPDSTQMISDTEATVKMRNDRGREIPLHVKKYDDRWLIVKADLGQRATDKMEKAAAEGGGAGL